ncbi:hypothetical protein V2P32_03485 [Mycoplasma sp. 06067-C1-B144P-99-0482-3]|uniref:hypothetical protein n=1 Tax=Mycoplasma sp. 06067-C1-B144P-99-0482-3 TaxID=3117438 RepID=UPI003DA3ED8A
MFVIQENKKFNEKKKLIIDTFEKEPNRKLLSIAIQFQKSLSTVKKYKSEYIKWKNKEAELILSHKNTNNKNAQKYSDEIIHNLGEKYQKQVKITSGDVNNASRSYLTLENYHSTLMSTNTKNKISYSTLNRRLIQQGYASPYCKRKTKKEVKKIRRQQEEGKLIKYSNELVFYVPKNVEKHRLAVANNYKFGQVIEVDGCTHYYFQNNTIATCVMAVDVGTNQILDMCFEEYEESLNSYQKIFETIFRTYGYPQRIITDNRANFKKDERNNARTRLELENRGIEVISSSNANAKPHVERMWDTVQKNAPFFFKQNDIKTIEQANQIKHKLIDFVNSKCKKRKRDNAFRQLGENEVEKFFDLPIPRKFANGVAEYKTKIYAPYDEFGKRFRFYKKENIQLVIGSDEQLYFRTDTKRYIAKPLEIGSTDWVEVDFVRRKQLDESRKEDLKILTMINQTRRIHSGLDKTLLYIKKYPNGLPSELVDEISGIVLRVKSDCSRFSHELKDKLGLLE